MNNVVVHLLECGIGITGFQLCWQTKRNSPNLFVLFTSRKIYHTPIVDCAINLSTSLFLPILIIRHKTFSRINIHLNDIHGSTRNLSDQIRNIHFVGNHLNNGDRNTTPAQILIATDAVALTQYIFIDKTFTKECTTTHTQQLKLKENLAAFRLKKVTLTLQY